MHRLDDDGKLRRKYSNKKVNAKKENLECALTFEEFVSLMDEANLKSSDLRIDGYHLARDNDEGHYVLGNCRFIPYIENYRERKTSECSRQSSRKNIKISHNFTSEERSKFLADSEKFNKLKIRRKEEAEINEKIRREKMNPSYTKENNSQYGTCWITNEFENKKISLHNLDEWIKKGYRRGRLIGV